MKLANHRITVSIACAVLSTAVSVSPARGDYASTLLSNNPVAYWQFNETAASAAPFKLANSGSAGSPSDAYANSEVVNGVAGKVKNAALFSNSGGDATYCGSRADVVYNSAINTPTFTVEFWAKPNSLYSDSTGAGQCPISDFNPNNTPTSRVGWLFYIGPDTGVWNFRMGLLSGYAVNIHGSGAGGSATVGTWQHIVATYDGTNANVYANGVLIGTQVSPASSTGWVPNTGSFLRFGGTPLFGVTGWQTADSVLPWDQASTVSGNHGYDGYLDEVAIYTNVLSTNTILAHYNAASNPNTYGATILADNPVGYWNFDELAVTPPSPPFPAATNSGTLASAADGTNFWGAVAAQPGPPYAGMTPGNKAVWFDGMNGSFAAKDAPGLHFTGNITMAAWIKPLANNYKLDIIEHGGDSVGKETFLRITRGIGSGFGSGHYYEVGTTIGEAGDGFYDAAFAPMPAGDIGNWVFVVGTFDGTTWNLYRNGLLAATAPLPLDPSDTGALDVTGGWTIGSRSSPSAEDGNRFAGTIDEPAIFTSALSPDQIMALYNAAHVPPVITRAVQVPVGTFKGSSAPFNVWAEGNTNLTYSWTSNSTPIAGNVTNITLNNLTAGPLTVACVVTNLYGSVTSSVSYTVLASRPLITQQPVPIKRFVGLPFQFSVVAGGTFPITNQWYSNNVAIPGATSSTYSGVVSSGTAGTYYCALSNEAGSSNTIPVTLTAVPIPGAYPGLVYSNAPIAYYRLDESNPSQGCNDFISGLNGAYNSTVLQVPGYSVLDPDTAASFSGPNSYVGNINGSSSGINFTGHTNFTLEAWVNAPAGQNDEATIIAKGIGATGTTRSEQFSLDIAGGSYRFFTSRGATLYSCDAVSGPDGTWQHIVAVYDDTGVTGPGTNMYLYVNGVLEGQSKGNPIGLNTTASAVSIGSKRTGNDPTYDGTFNGTIDEVAIYNYPLTSSQVLAHYGAAYGPNTAPFIAVQPEGVTNYTSLSATFNVAAAGTQPLQYTWRRNGVPLSDGPTAGGSTISGSGTQRMTITSLALADAGSYSVAITNGVNPGLTSISVPLVVLSPPTNAPAIPGLVLHLPFNGSLTDVTGRGNNAVAIHTTTNVTSGGSTSNVMTPTYVLDGPFGTNQAFHYSTAAVNTGGTTSIGTDDQYATLGVSPDLQFGSNVNFSVAFWIRLPQGFDGGDLPFFTDAKGSEGNRGFVFAPAYAYGTASPNNGNVDPTGWIGCWAFTVYGPANGVRVYGANGGLGIQGEVNDGSWHHLVHTFDRQAGKYVTYLDGEPNRAVQNAGTTLGAAGDINSGLPATIGQDPTGFYGEAGSGDIADLGVWRKTLTPLEAASIYMAATSNQLSFVAAPITLNMQRSGSHLILSWPAGTLQSTTNLTVPFTDVTPVSPQTITPTGPKVFYRVRL